jgi:hypothetical protein
MITRHVEIEALQKENARLRQQLTLLRNKRNLEEDQLVATLRLQNWQYIRKINQLNEFIVGVAKTVKTAFASYEGLDL